MGYGSGEPCPDQPQFSAMGQPGGTGLSFAAGGANGGRQGGPGSSDPLDAEIWATVLLASVLMAPRLFLAGVKPDQDVGVVARYYAMVLRRMMQSSQRAAR
jgi:hypothetical protein